MTFCCLHCHQGFSADRRSAKFCGRKCYLAHRYRSICCFCACKFRSVVPDQQACGPVCRYSLKNAQRTRALPPRPKKCKECKVRFVPKRNYPLQRYCTTECNKRALHRVEWKRNKKKILAQTAAWAKRNPELHKAIKRRYYLRNKAKCDVAARNRKRNAIWGRAPSSWRLIGVEPNDIKRLKEALAQLTRAAKEAR